jgi:putative membrane-bound dehydrogenase-like protein
MKPRVLCGPVGWVAVVMLINSCPADAGPPLTTDSRLEITLVASAPDIMTPIGIDVDSRGRIFVVESHTHFPITNYPGPKYDRVKLFEDIDRDGKMDRFSVFADGFHHAMNLARSPVGVLHLVHRNGVIRLDDRDGDGVSDGRATLLEMDTPGNYPHNGLGGIAFSPDGWLLVGQGVNLGERYTLKGSDGSSHIGKGEGGNVFRCRADGSRLQLVATGFWNPFGLAFYGKRFLLAVDNDPDSRPPNRLLDVVMGGDYGFKFRLGRSGLHPFQAWNGELPGTLPMIGGTGEAACHILPCDRTSLPKEYRDAILVSAAWDHQIEVHRPKPFGASLRADREVLVRGDADFRPVGMAAAPDGSVFVTDWVDVSYNVHGQGRLWRLAPKPGLKSGGGSPLALAANASRRKMERLIKADSPADLPRLRAGLSDKDAFVRSAAISSLAKPAFRKAVEGELEDKSPAIRLGAMLALRRALVPDAARIAGKMLSDPDEQVRLMAVIWAGEEQMTMLTNRLSLALAIKPVSSTLLRAHAATSQILSRAAGLKPGGVRESRQTRVTFFDLADRSGPGSHLETLKTSSKRTPLQTRLDAVRHLAQTSDSAAIALLKQIALDGKANAELRAESVLALAGSPEIAEIASRLLNDPASVVRVEAARAQRTRPAESSRPKSDDEWRAALAGRGEANSGRRVFFNPSIGCARCHRIEEFGGNIGPDLSTIARGADREKLVQSILHPSRDIAPQFVSHTVETTDGQEFTGLLIGQSVTEGVTLFMADSRAAFIPPPLIASQTQSKVSLMPEDLAGGLAVEEFRDLLAFLLSRK